MKTVILTILALVAAGNLVEGFAQNFAAHNQLDSGTLGYSQGRIPLHQGLSSTGLDNVLPFQDLNTQQLNPVEINLKVNLPSASGSIGIPQVPYGISNSIEKPVEEAQDPVPPQSFGTAVIPQLPPPATPVNAAASNVPGTGSAVFLGSGALGVVNLGNGQYALGSGSLGYSENRRQPRPSITAPLFPPLLATPDLIPAAVPGTQPTETPLPPPPPPPPPRDFNNDPLLNVDLPKVVDHNGYEFLPPNRVGFGGPNPNPVRLKTTQAFATPTGFQLPPQPSASFSFSPGFDDIYPSQTGFGQIGK